MSTTIGVTIIRSFIGFELCEAWEMDWRMVLGENIVKGVKGTKV
jgi:hypothetical protein